MSIIVPVDRTAGIIPISRRDQSQYPSGEGSCVNAAFRSRE
jgi:hypothetical protein